VFKLRRVGLERFHQCFEMLDFGHGQADVEFSGVGAEGDVGVPWQARPAGWDRSCGCGGFGASSVLRCYRRHGRPIVVSTIFRTFDQATASVCTICG
jgi:hypothetical protein